MHENYTTRSSILRFQLLFYLDYNISCKYIQLFKERLFCRSLSPLLDASAGRVLPRGRLPGPLVLHQDVPRGHLGGRLNRRTNTQRKHRQLIGLWMWVHYQVVSSVFFGNPRERHQSICCVQKTIGQTEGLYAIPETGVVLNVKTTATTKTKTMPGPSHPYGRTTPRLMNPCLTPASMRTARASNSLSTPKSKTTSWATDSQANTARYYCTHPHFYYSHHRCPWCRSR